MTTTRRVVTILVLALGVLTVWALVARTPWAGTVDPLTAGKAFTHPVEPFREIAGALLVAIPSVLLIRSGWSWFARVILGREAQRRVRIQRAGGSTRSPHQAETGESILGG
ncbi:MAG: hypothetical protein U9N79_02190 [Actinomycetota bacterium]|nr:hypothetical protein [Actinomycetota bacterium]